MRALIFVSGARISALVSAFLLFATLSRIVPLEVLNTLSIGLVYYGITLVVMDFGLQELITREVASQRQDSILSAVLGAKLILLLVLLSATIVTIWIIYSGAHSDVIYLAVAAGIVRNASDTIDAVLLGAGRYYSVAGFGVAYGVLALVIPVGAVSVAVPSANTVLLAQLFVGVLLLLLRIWFQRADVLGPVGVFKWPAVFRLFRQALPFGLMQFAAVIGGSAPSIWISLNSRLSGDLAVFYGSFRITAVSAAVGTALYGAIYANFARAWKNRDPGESRRSEMKAVVLFGLLSVGYIGIVALNASWITKIIYGPELGEVSINLRWQSLSVPLTIAALLPGALLPIIGQQNCKAVAVGVGAILTVPFIAVLGELYGTVGVSIGWTLAMCFQSLLICVFGVLKLRETWPIKNLHHFLFSGIAMLGAGFAIWGGGGNGFLAFYWSLVIIVALSAFDKCLTTGQKQRFFGRLSGL